MLKNHVSEVDFADNPNFADLTLAPLIALGHNVRIVTGFLPSYLSRTLSLLLSYPEKRTVTMSVVFCLPPRLELENDVQAITRALMAKSSKSEVSDFVRLATEARMHGIGIRTQFLIPSKGAVITGSAIGLITDRDDSTQLVGFIDEYAGDDNSPIHLARTWIPHETEIALRFEDLVHAAENDSWSFVNRIENVDFSELARSVEQFSELRDPANVDGGGNSARTELPDAVSSNQPDGDEGSELPLDELAPNDDNEFDELLALLEKSEGDSDALIAMFYGDLSDVKDIHDFLNERNAIDRFGGPHAAPVDLEIQSFVGNARFTCWCGNDYSLAEGCPENYA